MVSRQRGFLVMVMVSLAEAVAVAEAESEESEQDDVGIDHYWQCCCYYVLMVLESVHAP